MTRIRTRLSLVAAMAFASSSSVSLYGYPTIPQPPTKSRERHCSSCRVGILTGRLCQSCQRRGKR
jgi:hypothetical protein